jgi:hypothetical protein
MTIASYRIVGWMILLKHWLTSGISGCESAKIKSLSGNFIGGALISMIAAPAGIKIEDILRRRPTRRFQ